MKWFIGTTLRTDSQKCHEIPITSSGKVKDVGPEVHAKTVALIIGEGEKGGAFLLQKCCQ
jgi:hypothetical protein